MKKTKKDAFRRFLRLDGSSWVNKANKDYDLIIFPNARHGFGKDSFYMMRKRWDYFVTHLQGNIPPKEYKISFSTDPRIKRP